MQNASSHAESFGFLEMLTRSVVVNNSLALKLASILIIVELFQKNLIREGAGRDLNKNSTESKSASLYLANQF